LIHISKPNGVVSVEIPRKGNNLAEGKLVMFGLEFEVLPRNSLGILKVF